MCRTKVIFRADGGSEIGLGHVVRSLALAEMLYNFECVFAIQNPGMHLKAQIENVCSQIIELPVLSKNDKNFVFELAPYLTGKEIVVLDGYAFATEYQNVIKAKGCMLVCIDDIHAYHFVADVVINHAGGVKEEDYSTEPYTQCFLGPQYALLRPPFLKCKTSDAQDKSLKNILINMGGADPDNATCDVISEVRKCLFFDQIHVVTGAAYKYQKELSDIVAMDDRIIRHTAINAEQMASLMQCCGVCVCPPSSVSLEYSTINGLLLLKQIADNQAEIKSYLTGMGLAFDFDKDFQNIMKSDIQETYNKMLPKQRKLSDGRSDKRLRAIFHRLKLDAAVTVRPVRQEDIKICYEWANDVEVRQSSYNTAPIAFEDHVIWFSNKLKDPRSNFYIMEHCGKPAGQVRFYGGNEKVISYLVAPEMRGKGLGRTLVKKGLAQLLKDVKDVKKVTGYIKKSNIASCNACHRAGFLKNPDAETLYPDSVVYEFLVETKQQQKPATEMKAMLRYLTEK
jgi:UDP-2,4-diacetamido-2,4,6-trideoxy-beta-L-altropyranose hydrolase